jgi:hypothetical protein
VESIICPYCKAETSFCITTIIEVTDQEAKAVGTCSECFKPAYLDFTLENVRKKEA